MIKKFSDFISEGMWSSVMRRSKTGEERREDKDNTQYIDLGLPSGTLWGDRNLGATEPEEYGDYYAWGETEPKKDYSWDTYKWGRHYTKYNKEDGKTILDPEDDVAYLKTKGKAHIPTVEQIRELLKYTTSEKTTINGVIGVLFTSKINNNSIFLPYFGLMRGSSIIDMGRWSYCWSSSLDLNYNALCLHSFGGDSDLAFNYRYRGFSVRGVIDK